MKPTKKRVSIDLMHILKSVMDYKVKALREEIGAGRRAVQEEADISDRISAMRKYIINNRYDRSEILEAERDLEEYERQAFAIREKINRGAAAANQLKYADNFYATYNMACKQIQNRAKIQQLTEQKAVLEHRLIRLERNMEACEINMAPDIYAPDVVAQAQYDLVQYNNEYVQTLQEKKCLEAAIKSYQH